MAQQFHDEISDGPRDEQARQVMDILSNPLALPSAFLDKGPEAEDYVRHGFAPRGCDLRDFSIIRHVIW